MRLDAFFEIHKKPRALCWTRSLRSLHHVYKKAA
jgi:ribosomal protein L24E